MSARGQAAQRQLAEDTQPRLPLVFASAATGGGMTLEMSTPCAAAFDGDDWLFTVDWDGARCLLVIDGDGSVRVQGENAVLDQRYPGIVAGVALRGGRAGVLDGVICVLDEQGRPQLDPLSGSVAATTATPDATFLATDLLQLDGEAWTRRPLRARLAALADLIPTGSRLEQLPDHVVGHGRALADAAAARDLPAILARRADAPYRAGVASPDRLRIALSDRREMIVAGWQAAGAGLRAILAEWVEGRLTLAGSVLIPDPLAARRLILLVEAAGVAVEGGAALGDGISWVRPRLVATVRGGGEPRWLGLPAWELVALRDDVDPAWCMRRAPVAPPSATSHRPLLPFSPTVLSALPLDGAA